MTNPTRSSSFTVFLIVSLAATYALGEPSQTTREFRPLMAKKVTMVMAAQAEASVSNNAAQLTRDGWALFDARNWKAAADKFLSALEATPRDHSAAEGLTMSLYRSGDYASAVSVSAQLEPVMPQLKEMVAQTALADVKFMVDKSELAAAREFLSHFPTEDGAYQEAHATLGSASAIESAAGADGKDDTSGGTLAGR